MSNYKLIKPEENMVYVFKFYNSKSQKIKYLKVLYSHEKVNGKLAFINILYDGGSFTEMTKAHFSYIATKNLYRKYPITSKEQEQQQFLENLHEMLEVLSAYTEEEKMIIKQQFLTDVDLMIAELKKYLNKNKEELSNVENDIYCKMVGTLGMLQAKMKKVI